jgi:hypothetical protein
MTTQLFPESDLVSKQRIENGEAAFTYTQTGYKIGTFEYPEDLRKRPDLQHYVAFYINVRDKRTGGATQNPDAYFEKSSEEAKRIDALNESNRITENDAKRASKVAKDNAATAAVAGTIIAGIGMGTRLSEIPALAGKALGAGLAARIAVRMLDKLNLPDFAPGTTSRLKEVITLHVEDRPSVKYGVNYNDRELGALTGLLVQGSAAASMPGGLKAIAPELQARVISELIKLPSLKAGGGTLNDLREIGTRQKTNPFREVLFESVDYRSFNFRYRFFPKSERETQKIQNIIHMFKVHMHPETTDQRLFYIYPSEFDIQYFYKDKENPYVHKFARCALTGMTVDYGGEQFATFDDGAPTEINLTLSFRELEQITSEGIKKNGY